MQVILAFTTGQGGFECDFRMINVLTGFSWETVYGIIKRN